MNKIDFENNPGIYLFTESPNEHTYSMLSEFISFLKFFKAPYYYKFSYVGAGDGLLPELSLNENILMNFSPNSLTDNRLDQFIEYLKYKENANLAKLYQKLIAPNSLPTHTDTQMKKITSLIKSLVFEGQFIFLEEPENKLDSDVLELFIEALKTQIATNKQNVFIYSKKSEIWLPHAHNQIKRKAGYAFSIDPIAGTGPTDNLFDLASAIKTKKAA